MLKRIVLLAVLLGMATPFILSGCKKKESAPVSPEQQSEKEKQGKWEMQKLTGSYDPNNPD